MVEIMKTMRLVLIGLALIAGDAIAVEKQSDRERLVKLELSLGLYKASGLGERHPEIVRLNTEIQAIEKQNPGIRDKEYLTLLKENRSSLEEKQSAAIEEGIGERHPRRLSLARQLAAIDQQLKGAE